MHPHAQTRFRTHHSFLALGLILWIALIATFAVSRSPSFLQQRGAVSSVAELAAILAIYIAAIALSTRLKGERWDAVRHTAIAFGLLSALVETLSIVLENLAPQLFRHAVLSIALMLITFLIWAVAAVWKSPASVAGPPPWASGLLAASASAGLCMLLAVAIGFPIELFLKPPDPAVVATWSEYQRSGWTSARLFAVANTLDSGFTHLLLAPLVACIFGSAALLLARAIPKPTRAHT